MEAEKSVPKPVSSDAEYASGESTNPYTPTIHVDDEGWELTGQTLDAKNVRLIRVGRTVVTWEKLRLVYNLILACVTLLISGYCFWRFHDVINPERLFGTVATGMFFANVCFCLGPLIDVYLSWFGWRSPFTTGVIFLIGTLIAITLAAFAIVASTMPDF